ncbi:nuclear transport factor 2 family protein [Halothiobacillus sp.]|uniref:nuclear transport factor 2 family protein n=1 Tax=Halothiobacillus sp. TaxID=1891311 RepID=UPI0026055874|nr:nuclear transport factor 2 family protein [Halothiobacillus sp.]
MKSIFTQSYYVSSALVAGLMAATTAFAGPVDNAKEHFDAIGASNVNLIAQDYTADSRFYWIGGPLDGDYTGAQAIRDVWEKFTKAQGAMKVKVEHIEEAGNPKGTTVTANVVFSGKATIKVRYVLTYRGDKLIAETWQIAPKLATGSAY